MERNGEEGEDIHEKEKSWICLFSAQLERADHPDIQLHDDDSGN